MTNIPNDQFAPSTRSRVDENHAGGGWAALVTRHLRRVLLKKIRHWSLGILWSLAHCVIGHSAAIPFRSVPTSGGGFSPATREWSASSSKKLLLQVALFQQLAKNEFLSNLPSAALVWAYVGSYNSLSPPYFGPEPLVLNLLRASVPVLSAV